ncbi:MAG: SET domain-containing protein [Chitinophagaceae bacterium]|nr:SET domain-containing protein [Chitinophagaceae bacterium]
MITGFLEIKMTPNKGRGVFASADIEAGAIIEESPVIVLNEEERLLVEKTILNDYIFEWGDSGEKACMALGYIALYNHSSHSNCEYEMDFDLQIMRVKTMRFVNRGEELTVNYNGDWNNDKPVWFDERE